MSINILGVVYCIYFECIYKSEHQPYAATSLTLKYWTVDKNVSICYNLAPSLTWLFEISLLATLSAAKQKRSLMPFFNA